jgi:uncharacterized membrane protein YjjP (DUF1212 family)
LFKDPSFPGSGVCRFQEGPWKNSAIGYLLSALSFFVPEPLSRLSANRKLCFAPAAAFASIWLKAES